jgi:hypothetical protein
LGLENPSLAKRGSVFLKVVAGITKTHNPFVEGYWASCLRGNLTSSSYGEGLKTGREFAQEPRQSFTRQLFFKWIKQHLRIKSFYGTTENAVETQIWIPIAVYLIVAIIKKQLNLPESLYTILQVLSVSLFGKTSLFQMLTFYDHKNDTNKTHNQLDLFTNYSGQ